MRLIENIDTYYFDYRNGQTSLYLPKDRAYAGKVISGITLFSTNQLINTAPDGSTIVFFDRRMALSLYDEDSRCVVNDMMADNFYPGTVKPKIERRLNYDLSEIRILSAFADSAVPCCVEFRSEWRAPRPVPQPVNSLTVAITPDMFSRGFLMLSDLNLSALYGKRIWKLYAWNQQFMYSGNLKLYNWNAALTIREQEGRIFNQVPLSYFQPYKLSQSPLPDDTYFDGYIPDYYNSYIEINPKYTGNNPPSNPIFYLTFFY